MVFLATGFSGSVECLIFVFEMTELDKIFHFQAFFFFFPSPCILKIIKKDKKKFQNILSQIYFWHGAFVCDIKMNRD